MADTRRLIELDHRHVWHPFTPMRQWCDGTLGPTLVIERAQGEFLFDTDGNRYIDGVSSLWCNVHGHRVPEIDQAVREQLDKVSHSTLLGLGSERSIELAAELVRVAPAGLNKVFFSDAGATALEAAFKMAVGYWFHTGKPKKNRFVAFTGGYHGDTTGSMSVGYSEYFHKPFAPMVFPTFFVPPPDLLRMPTLAGLAKGLKPDEWPNEYASRHFGITHYCLNHLELLLAKHAEEIAAVVIEPVMQGAAGMICQPPHFVRLVADIAKRYNVLLIADEVATGFGRTGKMFACEQDESQPDIMCLAKGITGGYLPLAATLATDEIEQAFRGEFAQRKTLFHGHTYTGNALACAAALASLKLIESSNLIAHIQCSVAIIKERLDALRDEAKFPHVIDVRQRGLMIGIELAKDRRMREPFDSSKRVAATICTAMRSKGLIVRPLGDVIVLMPIPAMPHKSLRRMMDIVLETIGEMLR